MSNDVTFEELEKTAFEFAKSLAINNVQTGSSLQAMQLAKQWYAESDIRKSWYVCEIVDESDWIIVDMNSSYNENDFEENTEYWVMRGVEKPFKANMVRLEYIGGSMQPIFSTLEKPYETFIVDKVLSQSISEQLIGKTSPIYSKKE